MGRLTLLLLALGLAGSAPSLASTQYPTCALGQLHATAGMQGATGSMLGGISVTNPGGTCTFAGRPIVELLWHGHRLTPPQSALRPLSLRSMGWIRVERTVRHGKSVFVWMQWWNYCGAKPWGSGGFVPVAVLRVAGERGTVVASFRRTEPITAPYCNAPQNAAFRVSDFGVSP